MSKPEKVKYSGVACIIDGVITKRVQTLGANFDITRDAISELANTGVVQYVSQVPNVSIQIDTNDVGSTDTMALIADKMITYTHSCMAPGPRGGTYGHFIKSASSNSVGRQIVETDLLNGYVSVLATLNEEGTAAARTMWINHAAVTGVALSYDVNGNATENYTLAADNKQWFLQGMANVRCYKPTLKQVANAYVLSTAIVAPGAGVRGLAFYNLKGGAGSKGTAIPINSSVAAIGWNNYIYYNRAIFGNALGNMTVYSSASGGNIASNRNGSILATSYAWSTPAASGGWSTASGSTDRFWIIYKPSGTTWEATAVAANPGWELESTGGAIGAIRRGAIKAYLYNTNSRTRSTYSAAGRALRLQSVSIDVALGSDQLYELGTDGYYGITKKVPVPVTVTVSANDSDLEYFANMASTALAATTKIVRATDFNGYNGLRLEIYTDKNWTQLLKTITINKMIPQSENFQVAAGNNATQQMTFNADNITVVGSGYNVTGGHFGAL